MTNWLANAEARKIEPSRQASLFGEDEPVTSDSKTVPVVRQFDHPYIFIGTSSFRQQVGRATSIQQG